MMNRLHGTSFRWTKFEISAAENSSGADGPGVLVVGCNEETGECGCYTTKTVHVVHAPI
jgi:hypothetical protein